MIEDKCVYQKTYTNYGKVMLTINEAMNKKHINTYKLSVLTGVNWGIINKYAHNELYRVDLDILARICFVLDCKVEEIINYEYSINCSKKTKKNLTKNQELIKN